MNADRDVWKVAFPPPPPLPFHPPKPVILNHVKIGHWDRHGAYHRRDGADPYGTARRKRMMDGKMATIFGCETGLPAPMPDMRVVQLKNWPSVQRQPFGGHL